MKNTRQIIAILVLLRSFGAAASEVDEKTRQHCNLVGDLFSDAGILRDSGASQNEAYNNLSKYKNLGLKDDFIKSSINQVYFDLRFSHLQQPYIRESAVSKCILSSGYSLRIGPK